MSTLRRLAVLGLVLVSLLALAGAAAATDEGTDTTTITETSVVEDELTITDNSVVEQDELEATPGPLPAITVPDPITDESPDDWTYRYLIPTLIALAAVVVIVTTVQYFVQVVRKRYKVVE